jgi:probable phosphoglycerate mutase
MSRRVWLVRHGSTDWTGQRWCGTTDLPLNELGRAEVESLVSDLALRIDTDVEVISSPLRRALETADRLTATIGIAAAIDGRLREVDFGDIEGLDWAELEARDPGIARAVASGTTAIDWPGGETSAEVRSRVAGLWRDMVPRAAGLVLVSHAGVIRELLRQTVGVSAASLPIRPASVIELERGAARWALVA